MLYIYPPVLRSLFNNPPVTAFEVAAKLAHEFPVYTREEEFSCVSKWNNVRRNEPTIREILFLRSPLDRSIESRCGERIKKAKKKGMQAVGEERNQTRHKDVFIAIDHRIASGSLLPILDRIACVDVCSWSHARTHTHTETRMKGTFIREKSR